MPQNNTFVWYTWIMKVTPQVLRSLIECKHLGWASSRIALYFKLSLNSVNNHLRKVKKENDGVLPRVATNKEKTILVEAAKPDASPMVKAAALALSDPLLRYAVAMDIQANFLTTEQIARKHSASVACVTSISNAIRKGERFECPPGFTPTADTLTITDGHRIDTIKATVLIKVQSMLDAITEEKVRDLPADKLARAAGDLLKLWGGTVAPGSEANSFQDILNRAKNITVVLGNLNIESEEAAAIARLRAQSVPVVAEDAEFEPVTAPSPFFVAEPSSDE